MKKLEIILFIILYLLFNGISGIKAEMQFENIVPELAHSESSDNPFGITPSNGDSIKSDEISLVNENKKQISTLWEKIKEFVSSLFNPETYPQRTASNTADINAGNNEEIIAHANEEILANETGELAARVEFKRSSGSKSSRTVTRPTRNNQTSNVSGNSSSNSNDVAKVNSMKAAIKRKYGVNLTDHGASWDPMQLELVEKTFSKLPGSFLKATQNIVREPLPPPGKSRLIAAYVIVPQRKIHLLDWGSKMSAQYLASFQKAYKRSPSNSELYEYLAQKIPGNLVHEMTHCLQHTKPALLVAWKKQFNQKDSPTNYGKTNQREDMAESTRLYFLGGRIRGNQFVAKSGEKMDLARYNFIKQNVMAGKEF